MQIIVGTTPVALDVAATATPIVQNLGAGNVFFGDSTVTATTGIRLAPGAMYAFPHDLSRSFGRLFVVADAVGTDVRYLAIG